MRRISIGPTKDQRRSLTYERRSSLPSQIAITRIGKVSNETSQTNGHLADDSESESTSQKGPLPRLRRVNDRYNDFSPNTRSPAGSRLQYGSPTVPHHSMANHKTPVIINNKTPVSSPRRYPTHQPQFSGLGIMPKVQLHKTPRAVLSEQNSSMLGSSVTVKVAAPDVLKPPTPVFVQVPATCKRKEELNEESNPCDTESVISALREKRKRNLRDDETIPSSPEHIQATKRRKQLDQSMNGEVSLSHDTAECDDTLRPSNKRPAFSEDCDVSLNTSKRRRSESFKRKAVGVKNALEASFSSSKRWMDKVRDYSLNTSRDSSISRGRRSSSGERNFASRCTSRNTSVTNTPRHSITLDDDLLLTGDHGTLSNTSTPVPGTSGRTTPLTEGEQCDSLSTTPKKKKPLVLKEGSTKRRLIPSSIKSEDFSRVPRLRNQLTANDFEMDRKAEIDRVRQMLQEVDDEHKVRQEKKKTLLLGNSTTDAVTATATIDSSTLSSSLQSTTNSGLSLASTTSTSVSVANSKPVVNLAPLNTTSESKTSATTTSSSSQISTGAATAPLQISLAGKPVTQSAPTPTSSTAPTLPGGSFVLNTSTASSLLTPVSSSGATTGAAAVTTTANSSSATQLTFTPVFSAPTQSVSIVPNNNSTATTAAPGGFTFGVQSSTPTTTSTPFVLGVVNPTSAITTTAGGGLTLGVVSTASNFSATSSTVALGVPAISSASSTHPTGGFNFGVQSSSLAPSTSTAGNFVLGPLNNTQTKDTKTSCPFGESSGKLPERPGGEFNFGGSTVLSTGATATINRPPFYNQLPSSASGGFNFGVRASTNSSNSFQFGPSPVTSSFGVSTQPSTTQSQTNHNFAFSTNINQTNSFGNTNAGVGNSSFGASSVLPGFSLTGFGNTGTSAPSIQNNNVGLFSSGGNPPTTIKNQNAGLFSFGQGMTPAVTVQSNSAFGTSATTAVTTPASTGFAFGLNTQSNQAQTAATGNSNTFQFGGASNKATTQSSASSGGFSFGQTNQNSQNTTAGIFGNNGATNNTASSGSGSTFNFGQTSNGFGSANTNTAPAFGAGSQSATSQSGIGTFPFSGNQPKSSGFGLPNQSFASNGPTTGTFGATATPFGNNSSTSNFGSAGFGNASNNDQTKPFDFSKSAGGGGSSFNFAAQSPTANFGTPSAGTPAPGNMFTPGATTAPRQRTARVARRRGAKK